MMYKDTTSWQMTLPDVKDHDSSEIIRDTKFLPQDFCTPYEWQEMSFTIIGCSLIALNYK